MGRKIIGLALGSLLLALSLPAGAQQQGKVPQVGCLDQGSRAARAHLWEAFRQGLRGLGYVEGQNITIKCRWAEGRTKRLPELAAELIRLEVDVIVTAGSPATEVARKGTTTIPIVMANVGDPVGFGFVASLARPGGNVTGLSTTSVDITGKRLELLKEVIPGLTRVSAFSNPANAGNVSGLKEIEVAARLLRVSIQALEVRGADGLESAFAATIERHSDALMVLPDALFFSERRRLGELALKHRLATMFVQKEYVEAGGLMSYGTNLADLFRRAATYVDKILKGTKPADLPVEQPTKFEFVINLKTAKHIGLTIPPNVLARADKVIK